MTDQERFEVVAEVRVIKQRFEDFMGHTNEYRKHLCDKVDKITDKLANLPCGERKGFYVSVSNQLRAIWGIIVIGIAAIVGAYFRK